jgi:hypothetical protein
MNRNEKWEIDIVERVFKEHEYWYETHRVDSIRISIERALLYIAISLKGITGDGLG